MHMNETAPSTPSASDTYKGMGWVDTVVGADLEGLVLAHQDADLARGLVLQQLEGTSAALLPLHLASVKVLVIAEHTRAAVAKQ